MAESIVTVYLVFTVSSTAFASVSMSASACISSFISESIGLTMIVTTARTKSTTRTTRESSMAFPFLEPDTLLTRLSIFFLHELGEPLQDKIFDAYSFQSGLTLEFLVDPLWHHYMGLAFLHLFSPPEIDLENHWRTYQER